MSSNGQGQAPTTPKTEIALAEMRGRLKAYKVMLRRRLAGKSMDANYFKDLVRLYELRVSSEREPKSSPKPKRKLAKKG